MNRRFGTFSLGRFALGALLLVVGLALPAHAQSGKLTGVVTDAVNGDPLPGVNVVLVGTDRGAATNMDGEYTMIGVRPGQYTMRFSYIGYQTTMVEDVQVKIDLTTEIDVEMQEQVYEGQEVVVTAERPLVERDVTATTSIVSGEKIEALPVENFGDVVNLQAGVVDGHFRGGRTGEVGYWIDGMPVTDVYSGNLGVAVENNMVDQMQVVTGAFNAEYGQAMSGIVNVVTRSGSNEFSGSVRAFTGDYASGHTDLFSNISTVEPAAVRNVEGSLSGPIIEDNLFFFASGRYFGNDGWTYGRDIYRFDDVGFNSQQSVDLLNPEGSGDSSFVAMNPYEKMSGQVKLTWRASDALRLDGNVILSQEDWRNYDHALVFIPERQIDKQKEGYTAYLKATHTLSETTFYEFGVTNTYSSYREYLFEDENDPRYQPEQFNFYQDYLERAGFSLGGTDNSRFSRATNTYLAKLDVTTQLTKANMVKGGLEFRLHDLEYNDDDVILPRGEGSTPVVQTSGRYDFQPIEAAAYVQDKIELGDLVINAGVRFDYFDSNGRVLKNPTDPEAVFLENRVENLDLIPEGGLSDFTPDEHFTDVSAKWQISPRLGVAFPVSAGGVIHFSYGHFFQAPSYQLLYQNPYFLLGSSGSGLIGLIGNADLEPEQTINGEIGFKQELSASSAIELTAYYRDIRNLAGTATAPIQVEGTSARYGRFENTDFGFVRGIVFRYDQRVGDGFVASADYTYQIAKANASDPSQVYSAAAADRELENQLVPTDWDQRHTFNASLTYTGGDWGFSVLGSFGTGQPYTPSLTTKQSGVILPTRIPLNSENKPFFADVDLTAYRNFSLAGAELQVFTKVDNVFDIKNEQGVFGDTGRATYSLQKTVDESVFRGPDPYLERWYTRPMFFSEPRRMVVGLQYSF